MLHWQLYKYVRKTLGFIPGYIIGGFGGWWLKCVPWKDKCSSSNSGQLLMWFTWKQGLCKYNRIKIRPPRCTLARYNWSHIEESDRKRTGVRQWLLWCISKGVPRIANNCQKLWENHKTASPWESRGTNPANTFILDFWPPNCQTINFYCFKAPSLCWFLTATQAN
jgi:hypothetical protein